MHPNDIFLVDDSQRNGNLPFDREFNIASDAMYEQSSLNPVQNVGREQSSY
jgi:hypothetical protein